MRSSHQCAAPTGADWMPRAAGVLGLCLAIMVVTGCDYPLRNVVATRVVEGEGYRLDALAADSLPDTLVIVTASGGGTRATALALSVLKGLDAVKLPNGHTLAEEIDVLSTVSGGSVAGGYFALTGPTGLKILETQFVRRDGIAALLLDGANPLGLARLATPGTERIDLLIDYLDRQLFDHAIYQTLLDRKARPYLILNAADMVEGLPFSFTQRKFDLLCSDLTRFSLATAVAASAAFPVALSPVTLKNYQPCEALKGHIWPPQWVASNLDDAGDPSVWYDNPQRASLARAEYAYALGARAPADRQKLYVHLLDGGIADNLGLFEPLRMLATADTDPSFLNRINSGAIRKLILVTINARSAKGSALDQQQATPGAIDMLLASIGAPIDRTTAGMAGQLRQLLFSEFRNSGLTDPRAEARFAALEKNTALISVDFDAIAEETCRRKFQAIATSWTLPPRQVDALLEVGQALLANDPAFDRHLLPILDAARPELPTLTHACGLL